MLTRIFHPGQKKNSLTPWRRREKANKRSLSVRCIGGAQEHLALKAGGNEKGQLNVAEKGIVTTPEKYTIAHSNHVGLKFIALKWADLKSTESLSRRAIDLRDTDSEDNVNYRPNEERHSDRKRG